tara:strand:- start:274 stop:396 length:123 start_codon:yes stop_codon:yes gene_type:complete
MIKHWLILCVWRRVSGDPFEGRLRAKNADYTTVDKKTKKA